MHLTVSQWVVGIAAGLMVGISKTGIPGVGILVVSMLAYAFGGWASTGLMLPMLVFGDCFAVLWYRRHAQWDKLVGLLPWILVGMGIAFVSLWQLGKVQTAKDTLGMVIGFLVLIMLAIHLLSKRMGDRLSPKSKIGVAATGASAGFATTVSNAAGPIMQIFLSAYDMPKEQFMGTIAWYFFSINVLKLPVFGVLTYLNPQKPMITGHSLLIDLLIAPAILAGAFMGKWLLPRVSQKTFDALVLFLAGIAAAKLIVDYFFPGMTSNLFTAMICR